MKLYSIREFAEKLGVSVSTLRVWDRDGKLIALRTPTNKRRYTEEMLHHALGLKDVREPQKNVLYARVFSKERLPDLENLVDHLKNFSAAQGMVIDEILTDIGSGLNCERKNFLELCDMVIRNEVKTIIVSHKDQLIRFEFEFFEKLFARFGCKLLVMNRAEESSSSRELAEDLIGTVQQFAAKIYGQRSCKTRMLCKTIKDSLTDILNN